MRLQWHRTHPERQPRINQNPFFLCLLAAALVLAAAPGNTPAEFAQFLKSEYARWDQLMKLSGVT